MNGIVRDLMHRGLITCTIDARLGEAAARLVEHRIHALVVVDVDGQPQGILSDLDLLAGEWLATDSESLEALRAVTAGELMSAPPVAIDADASAVTAAKTMRETQVHRLLVVEGGEAVGIVSVSDFVGALMELPTSRAMVRDVMSRGIVVCRPETPLSAAARVMSERRTRSIVVVNAHGAPLGIVTGTDLLDFCEAGCGELKVSQVMHPPMTMAPTATLREAADRMIQARVHRLLVVDPDEPESMPLGLISTYDIVAEMAEPDSVWRAK